jgi:hypothetical protein
MSHPNHGEVMALVNSLQMMGCSLISLSDEEGVFAAEDDLNTIEKAVNQIESVDQAVVEVALPGCAGSAELLVVLGNEPECLVADYSPSDLDLIEYVVNRVVDFARINPRERRR